MAKASADGETAEISRDMAMLSDFAVRVRRFLEHIHLAFGIYAFALGVITGVTLLSGLGEVFRVPGTISKSTGLVAGLAISIFVYASYTRRIFRVTGNIFRSVFPSMRELIALNILVGTVWAILWQVIESINPAALDVIWHPGLALTFLLVYFIRREKLLKPHFIASLIMIPFSPLVIIHASQLLALGSMMTAYYVAGIYSLRKALNIIEQGPA